jgi:glycosyltransferase involved in cell wall biosynthesis
MSKKSDLTHTTLYSGAVCAGMAKRVTGKRTLITIHELYKDIWSSLPYISSAHSSAFQKMESKALKMDFDAYVGVSDFTTNQIKNELKENKLIRKIYNGIDYTEFEEFQRRSREEKPFRFVFFGRAGIGKGIDLISGAIRMCLEEDLKDIELNLILAQESSKPLQDLKRAANPAVSKGMVKFHRPMERMDLLGFLSACDCALIPSYSEGFCFVAVECAAMGLPVIHSGKGALKETVSGFNIQMSDQTSASLFNAMKDALYNNYDNKPQKRFPVENTIRKYTELYEELIKL